MIKKVLGKISILLLAILVIALTTACDLPVADSENVSVVVTIFPEYDWVRNVVGDVKGVDVTLLLDDGTDMHSYQPSVADFARVSNSDVFVYVGGESDSWIEGTVQQLIDDGVTVINLMDVLDDYIREEEIKEGMEEEKEDGEDSEEVEYDEHVWLSLNNAVVCCEAIKDAMILNDSEHESEYVANFEKYKKELLELDKEYAQVVSDAKYDIIVVADRFPFRYLVEDYGIDYYAAFPGCSADVTASFETMDFLINKVDQSGVRYVITTENSDESIANLIVSNTKEKDKKILKLDSIQTIDLKNNNDSTYLSVMEENLAVLKKALGDK